MVRSPLEFTCEPVEDLELAGGLPENELATIARMAGLTQLWNRPDCTLGVKTGVWLRLHNFHNGTDWEGFFTPNGAGSVEINLGFSVAAEEVFLLVLPYWERQEKLILHHGLLDPKRLDRFRGFSLAFTPTSKQKIQRGEPLARLIPLTKTSFEL